MDFVAPRQFHQCVDKYSGNHKVKTFCCWGQFPCMASAQFIDRKSIRDIQVCLRAAQQNLYHVGCGNASRNTPANANQVRDWGIYADFAQGLITTARSLYSRDDFGLHRGLPVYDLDATTIDLCLSLLPWAKFGKGKGAVKMHGDLTCGATFRPR